ncbi:MAG: erythromycin esterase family protein [Pseudomonadota bacterium]
MVTVPPPVGVPPAPPPTSLLTDSELVTGADTRAARTDADAVAWFAENAQIIRSLTADDDFSDLTFLAPLVQSKSMVLLGESSHGVREYSVAKTRLIKFLHETQGFNVLAFEGGVFDCETAQDVIVSLGAREAMRSCLFGVWQTQTLLDLFEYVRETQSTTRPLRLTGFDTQISGTRFARRAGRTAALLAKVSPDRAALARQLEDDFRFLIFNAQNATAATDPGMVNLRDAQTRLDTEFAALSDDLRANAALITADGEFSVADVLLAAQYTATSPLLARQVTQRFELGAGGVPRDEGMAQNLIGLATAIYPDEKIIVWAHNAHLRHRGTGFLPERNMGSLVHAALADRMYTIGFYMYRGEHAFNDRRVVPVSAPQNFSLEAIFHSRRLAWLFLDLENAQRTPGHEWIDAATPTWAWGQWETTLRLSEEYDGLVILDSVQSPVYID